MGYKDVLEIASNSAAILTAAVATIAYGQFIWAQSARREALEDYLRGEKMSGVDQGQRSVIHIMGNLAMTEADVLRAGFQSKKIKSIPKSREDGFAGLVLFEYIGSDISPPQKF